MKCFSIGDTSRAICFHCEEVVDITFKIKDVPTSDGRVFKGVLVGCCNQCNSVISIPACSTEIIKNQLEDS